jgi:hypothetical protein
MVLECARGPCRLIFDERGDEQPVEIQCHLEVTTSYNEYDGLEYGYKRRNG